MPLFDAITHFVAGGSTSAAVSSEDCTHARLEGNNYARPNWVIDLLEGSQEQKPTLIKIQKAMDQPFREQHGLQVMNAADVCRCCLFISVCRAKQVIS